MPTRPEHAPTFAFIASVLMCLSFLLAGWSFYQSKRATCEGRDKALDVIVDLLDRTRPTPAEFAAMPPDRRDRTLKFFAFADNRIQAARRC